MKSVPLENPDVRFGAPANWNHETDGICHTLDVWRRDGAWVSGWRPSESELAKLNAGEPLFLHIFLDVHPVIAWGVGYAQLASPPATCKCQHPGSLGGDCDGSCSHPEAGK